MENQFLGTLMEQGFNIILLCVAVYYMHKRVEKVERQKEDLTNKLIELHQKTIKVIDELTDQLKVNTDAIEQIKDN